MVDGAPSAPVLPCVIDWSDRLDRAEQALRKAVIAMIVSDSSQASPAIVANLLAARFNLDVAVLPVIRAGQGEFVVVLEDEAEAARVSSDNSQPAGNDQFRVHCRRWNRQALSSGTVLPVLVDVELRGLPVHAWEVSTAEQLLNPYGWVEQIHAATRNREDFSVFQLKAWCNPELIPCSRDLVIVEPPVVAMESPTVKRALVYPVQISVFDCTPQQSVSPSPPSDGGSGKSRERRRPRYSESTMPASNEHHEVGAAHGISTRAPAGSERSASGEHRAADTVEADGSPSGPGSQTAAINAIEGHEPSAAADHSPPNTNIQAVDVSSLEPMPCSFREGATRFLVQESKTLRQLSRHPRPVLRRTCRPH